MLRLPEDTLNFGPRLAKLGWTVWGTKKIILTVCHISFEFHNFERILDSYKCSGRARWDNPMRSKKLISPHGGLVPILNLMGLYLCRPAGSNLSWWHWYWGWKWRRWDDDKMKAVNQLWNFSCLLDLDSFNLTGCAEFLTLWVSSVLVDMKSKLTIFIFLKLCFQKLSLRDQTSCVFPFKLDWSLHKSPRTLDQNSTNWRLPTETRWGVKSWTVQDGTGG